MTKASVAWVTFISFGAVYWKIDDWLSDPRVAQPHKGLPFLQDIRYQGALWGTSERIEGPSFEHILGTDVLGRDQFARFIASGWNFLALAAVAIAVGATCGVLVGWSAAKLDRSWRELFESLFDAVEAFPPLLAIIVLALFVGPDELFPRGTVLGLAIAPSFMRSVRRMVIESARNDTVTSVVWGRVAWVVAGLTLANMAIVIGIDTTAAFVGFRGAEPSWGSIINEGRSESVARILLPAVWVALTSAAFTRLAHEWSQADGRWMQLGVHTFGDDDDD